MNSITDWIIAISSSMTTLLTLGILIGAYYQIKHVKAQLNNLAESNKNNTLMTVLELESELNKRKENLDHVNFELREYDINRRKARKGVNEELVILMSEKINVARENYLNALDRISYCIIHNYILDRDWKTEYREVVFDVVENNENCFGLSSRFRNTKKLYEKWKIE